jgi:CheY-like chemotaxis protein
MNMLKPVCSYTSNYKFIENVKFHANKKACSCAPVLIVDDSSFNLFTLSSLLSMLSVKSDQATNGEIAISTILKASKCQACRGYSLIFMDCEMPVKNGYETSKELTEMMSHNTIKMTKIVALTGHMGEEEMKKCADHGMCEFCKHCN